MRNRKVNAAVNLYETLEEIRQWVGERKAKSYTRKGCRVSMANPKVRKCKKTMHLLIYSVLFIPQPAQPSLFLMSDSRQV